MTAIAVSAHRAWEGPLQHHVMRDPRRDEDEQDGVDEVRRSVLVRQDNGEEVLLRGDPDLCQDIHASQLSRSQLDAV